MVVLVLAIAAGTKAQSPAGLFADNNPRLTPAESSWMNEQFKEEHFDFTGKYICFTEVLSGPFYGIGKMTLPVRKKELARLSFDKYQYRLLVLDAAERQRTRGYDAVLLMVLKKNRGKLERISREAAIGFSKMRYPQFTADAGLDTNAQLSPANALFFNELHRTSLYPDSVIDFTDKKVAIFRKNYRLNKIERVPLRAYIEDVKRRLDAAGFSHTDFTYILTPEQRTESGGYDVIIQYQDKKDVPLSTLIALLK